MDFIDQEINGYYFERRIGKGAFGAVYKVKKGDQFFAAKVLRKDYILRESRKKESRITREVEVLKRVHGQYLVHYVDDFYCEDHYIIIMEYFAGKSLRVLMETETDQAVLLEVFRKVLYGVRELHSTRIGEEGIVHRDLKPENILVDEEHNVKVIDYGLSKIIDFASITATKDQFGSPMYLSPEQQQSGKHVDYRTDIYALGIILYEIMTKEYPYRFSDINQLNDAVEKKAIIRPKEKNPKISDELERIILRATSRSVFARFQSIDEFLEALDGKELPDPFKEKGKYYAWINKEWKVTEKFEKENQADIIYPIHVRNWKKKLHHYFCDRGFENVLIDPSTQRLSYQTFRKTKGLVDLPYAPKEDVVSISYLNKEENRKAYLESWYQTVSMGKKLILPYHYIPNPDYSNRQMEQWLNMNLMLIHEGAALIEEGKKKYAMISTAANTIAFRLPEILGYYTKVNVDGFLVQTSNMEQMNKGELRNYLTFIVYLQKYTGKPVVALKVPVPLGLTLAACGVCGFSLGLSQGDFFEERYMEEEAEDVEYSLKFYMPQLYSFFLYPEKDTDSFAEIYNHLEGCSCKWCQGKTAEEICSSRELIQLHHWQMMQEEVENLNERKDLSERIQYLKDRMRTAIQNVDTLPDKKRKEMKKTKYYSYIKTILEIDLREIVDGVQEDIG